MPQTSAMPAGQPPKLNWLQLLGGAYDDIGFVLTSGVDGSIYLGGETDRGAWDSHANLGVRDGFVSRFNLAGQRLWTQWFATAKDDQVRGLSVDPYGFLYLSGGTQGNLNGSQTAGTPPSDGFLSRISNSGQKGWTLQLGAESWDLLRSLATSPTDSAVYGIGYTASLSFSMLAPKPAGEEGPDAFVIKADASGNLLWATRIGSGKQDYGMNLAVGTDGYVYATGFSGNSSADSPADAFLSKLDPANGSILWTDPLGTGSNDYGEDLTIGKDGSVYVLISSDGNLGGQINQGDRDIGVQKYDRDGNLIWTVLHGTPAKEEGRTISTGFDGSVYVSGVTAGNLGGQINQGGTDGFVTRITADGAIAWTRLFGTAGDDVAWSVSSAGHNSLIVSGLTRGNLEGRSSLGQQDAFIASLSLSESPTSAPLPSVSVTLARGTVREGKHEPIVYRFSRTGSLLQPLSIGYSLSGTAQADYSGAIAAATNTIILPAGETSVDLRLDPIADGLAEADESVVLQLDPGEGYVIATPHPLQATILGEANHEPIATSEARLSARLGGGSLTGQLSALDPDPADRTVYTLIGAAPPGFVLQENGSWSFDPADPAIPALAAGERRSILITYRVNDRVATVPPPLPGGVIRVGGPDGQFGTIQEALNQAEAGAVIVVAPGTYDENLTISKAVTLLGAFQGIPADEASRGQSGKESVIRGYVDVSAAATAVTLDGLTLIGSASKGVNLRMQAANSRLVNSIITGVKPQGGYADFAFVKYMRDTSLGSGFSNVTVENNVFNGIVDHNARPVPLQINRALSARVEKNTFLNTGGGGNIVLADDFDHAIVKDNLCLGGGKGLATFNGIFNKLIVEDNIFQDSNLNGVELNQGTIIKSGHFSGNQINGSGIDIYNSRYSPIFANLFISSTASIAPAFQFIGNDLRNPYGDNLPYRGSLPLQESGSSSLKTAIGRIRIDLSNPTPAAVSPIALAHDSDAARFQISRFASGLGFPSSMAELEDGSLLVAVTLGDPANRSPFGTTPSQLLRLVDSNRDGSSEAQQVLATLPGFVTSVRRSGDLIFALSSGRQTISPTLTILRTGPTPNSPLQEVAVLQFQMPPEYLNAVNPHSSYALAVRASSSVESVIELFFNLGPLEEDRSTDPSITIGLKGYGDLDFAPAQMVPDSIQRLLITDRGDRLFIGAPETVATGVRNAAGMTFDRAGNLVFQDNGFSNPANGENTFTSDELNRINADEIGLSIPDFGFAESYVRYSDGALINAGPGYRPPLVSFLPLEGRKSEGAVEVSQAPTGFPSEFRDTVFTAFFGKFGVGTSRNDENPIVAAEPESGAYHHFINSGQLGNPSGLLAAGGSLFVADYSSTGTFFGSAAGLNADQAGAIYRITPVQEARFLSLPGLSDTSSSTASVSWTLDSDAISSLELWGGSIPTQAPRLYSLTPVAEGSVYKTQITLTDLQPATEYLFRVRLGDQLAEAGFRTPEPDPANISIAIAPISAKEDGGNNLIYTITRSGLNTKDLAVNYSVTGTATPGIDFSGIEAVSGRLNFAANASTTTLMLHPLADAQIEPDETIIISLEPGEGYRLEPITAATGTIINDDNEPAGRVVNQQPLAGRPVDILVDNQAPEISGSFDAVDPEGDPVSFSLVDRDFAGFSLSRDGQWRFNPRDPAYTSLPPGQSITETLYFRAEDDLTPKSPQAREIAFRVENDPRGYKSIQDALDAAPAGSTIWVAPGDYTGNLVISKPVVLLGSNHGISALEKRGDETRIRGFVEVKEEAQATTIDGFTLLPGQASTWKGTNLRIEAASSQLLNNVITSAKPYGGYAHSGFVSYSAQRKDIVISGNLISGIEDPTGLPNAIRIFGSDNAVIRSNAIIRTGGGGNIGTSHKFNNLTVDDNLIIGGGEGFFY